jgi:hypothetical protein
MDRDDEPINLYSLSGDEPSYGPIEFPFTAGFCVLCDTEIGNDLALCRGCAQDVRDFLKKILTIEDRSFLASVGVAWNPTPRSHRFLLYGRRE